MISLFQLKLKEIKLQLLKLFKVIKMAETKRIAEPAIEKLTAEIIAKQSVEVDSVAGATYTSEGFKEAIADALKK